MFFICFYQQLRQSEVESNRRLKEGYNSFCGTHARLCALRHINPTHLCFMNKVLDAWSRYDKICHLQMFPSIEPDRMRRTFWRKNISGWGVEHITWITNCMIWIRSYHSNEFHWVSLNMRGFRFRVNRFHFLSLLSLSLSHSHYISVLLPNKRTNDARDQFEWIDLKLMVALAVFRPSATTQNLNIQ